MKLGVAKVAKPPKRLAAEVRKKPQISQMGADDFLTDYVLVESESIDINFSSA